MNWMSRIRGLAGLAIAAICVFGAVGCGSDNGGGGGGGTIIRGTTDVPVGLDPAGVYDLPSWDLIVNDPTGWQQAGARRGNLRLHQPDDLPVQD
jgi:hypothetical protein